MTPSLIFTGELHLAADDDALAIQVTSSKIHDHFGTDTGFCHRLRGAFEVSEELASRMGISSKVRVVDGTMIFVCMDTGPEREPRVIGDWGPVKVHLWALTTEVERGVWTVSGTYHQPAEGWPAETKYLDLPHAPDHRIPVQ